MNAKVVIYSTASCPYCVFAKELLEANQVSYQELRVDEDPNLKQEMMQLSGRRTVPQIFIGDRHVGGYDDLKALYERGELSEWLNRE